MKIAIIGYSGCGKSTLARCLGKYYHIPVLFLDRVHWLPGWQEQDLEKEVRQVKSFLDKNDFRREWAKKNLQCRTPFFSPFGECVGV